jgi:hypothetical protein
VTLDSLLSQTLKEWADEARAPHDLADQVLTRRVPRASRFRSYTVLLAAAATAAVVTGGVLVPRLLTPPAEDPASQVPRYPVATPVDTTAPLSPPTEVTPADLPASLDIHADTENSPPKQLIAAGRIAVSSYFVYGTKKTSEDSDRGHDIWHLYNPGTGAYEATDWSTLDVAPGLRDAAVLERGLPVRRLGILDMTTRDVRWVAVDPPVTDVSWSPDGTKILATSFDEDRSIRTNLLDNGASWNSPRVQRLGFHIVDAASGQTAFHQGAETEASSFNTGPFRWSLDGTLVSEANPAANGPQPTGAANPPTELFYDLNGRPHAAPARDMNSDTEAGYSPDGRLYAGWRPEWNPTVPPTLSPEDLEKVRGPQTAVVDVESRQVVGRQEMLQLRAWADDRHLIGLQCLGTCKDEFDSRLVVVTLDGTKSVRLSGEMLNSQKPGSWHPLLTRR